MGRLSCSPATPFCPKGHPEDLTTTEGFKLKGGGGGGGGFVKRGGTTGAGRSRHGAPPPPRGGGGGGGFQKPVATNGPGSLATVPLPCPWCTPPILRQEVIHVLRFVEQWDLFGVIEKAWVWGVWLPCQAPERGPDDWIWDRQARQLSQGVEGLGRGNRE